MDCVHPSGYGFLGGFVATSMDLDFVVLRLSCWSLIWIFNGGFGDGVRVRSGACTKDGCVECVGGAWSSRDLVMGKMATCDATAMVVADLIYEKVMDTRW